MQSSNSSRVLDTHLQDHQPACKAAATDYTLQTKPSSKKTHITDQAEATDDTLPYTIFLNIGHACRPRRGKQAAALSPRGLDNMALPRCTLTCSLTQHAQHILGARQHIFSTLVSENPLRLCSCSRPEQEDVTLTHTAVASSNERNTVYSTRYDTSSRLP